MYHIFKRLLDSASAFFLIVVTSPLILLIAAAVQLTMGWPVIFRHMLPGRHENLFTSLKFRTMTNAYDCDGKMLSEKERTTRLGRFLRNWSLDELPQLWNVLRGDLSFIGPRPLFVRYLPYYTQEERRRHWVRPGLTGWAQVQGNSVPFETMLEMDVWYVDHLSFWLDLKIVAVTVCRFRRKKVIDTDIPALDELRARKISHAI